MSVTTTATRTYRSVEAPAAGTYAVDPAHSHIAFSVRHMMVSKVRGRFTSFTGFLVINEEFLSSAVNVDIATASIDTGENQRDTHLRSADFLDVERYPTMTYRGSGLVDAGGGRWRVDGALTLHGVTRIVPLEVSFEGGLIDPSGAVRAGFGAHAEIDRDDFGLTWNQALETGGVMVSRKVTIDIDAEAILQN